VVNVRLVAKYTSSLFCFWIAGCVPPLTLLPEELPSGIENAPYSQTLTSDAQASDQWEVTSGSLPPGLSLDTATGVLEGIPTTAGTYEFTVTATEFSLIPRTGQRGYLLTIIPELTLDATLTAARVNEAYTDTFAVTGGVEPYTFTVVGLPAGLSLDETAGTVSGTPLTANAGIQLQVTLVDSGTPQQTVTQASFLAVKPPPVAITTTALADGAINQVYSDPLEANDGTTPYTWSLGPAVGSLPPGLRLDVDTGEISGTPTQAGTFQFTITVTDADSPETSDSVQFTLKIQP